jgi:hypothetical protein
MITCRPCCFESVLSRAVRASSKRYLVLAPPVEVASLASTLWHPSEVRLRGRYVAMLAIAAFAEGRSSRLGSSPNRRSCAPPKMIAEDVQIPEAQHPISWRGGLLFLPGLWSRSRCLLSDSMPELFTVWVAAARAMSPPRRSVWELVKEEIDGGNFAIPDDYEISSGIGWRPARAARSRTLQHERHPSFLEALAERGALRAEVQNSCRERGMLG